MKICYFPQIIRPLALLFILLFASPALAQVKIHPYARLEPIENFTQLNYPYQVNYIALEDVGKIAYIDIGKGEKTILFIHGLGSYSPAWMHNLETLSKEYRCIAIDLPGYGHSEKRKHSGQMTYYAEVIHQFLSQLKISTVHIAGHSMGGQIALTFALMYPDICTSLILIAPAGFETFTEGQKQWFREVMTVNGVRNTSVADIQNNLAYNFFRMPRSAEFMVKDRIIMRGASDFEAYCYAIVQSVKGMVDQPVYDVLHQVKQPSLIIYGKNDNLIPNRYLNPGTTKAIAKDGASKMPNASLHLIRKAGHFVHFEKANEVNNLIKNFLK
jgi:pimeloyl-ACP methyl ester carboxylesterase